MVTKSAEELIEGEVLDTDMGPVVIGELDSDSEMIFIYGTNSYSKVARRDEMFGVFDKPEAWK